MSIVNLIFYVLLIVFVCSAVSGIVMFFVDMIRFGTPHKRFETVSSIEKYNERLEEIRQEIKDNAADQSDNLSENTSGRVTDFEIDL